MRVEGVPERLLKSAQLLSSDEQLASSSRSWSTPRVITVATRDAFSVTPVTAPKLPSLFTDSQKPSELELSADIVGSTMFTGYSADKSLESMFCWEVEGDESSFIVSLTLDLVVESGKLITLCLFSLIPPTML